MAIVRGLAMRKMLHLRNESHVEWFSPIPMQWKYKKEKKIMKMIVSPQKPLAARNSTGFKEEIVMTMMIFSLFFRRILCRQSCVSQVTWVVPSCLDLIPCWSPVVHSFLLFIILIFSKIIPERIQSSFSQVAFSSFVILFFSSNQIVWFGTNWMEK